MSDSMTKKELPKLTPKRFAMLSVAIRHPGGLAVVDLHRELHEKYEMKSTNMGRMMDDVVNTLVSLGLLGWVKGRGKFVAITEKGIDEVQRCVQFYRGE